NIAYAVQDACEAAMSAKVNNAVKFREWWRPFAPSLKKEAAGEYLETAMDSPFMILTAQVRPEKRGVIPAVTHVDGSARPQTVEKDINPLYWRLISFSTVCGRALPSTCVTADRKSTRLN